MTISHATNHIDVASSSLITWIWSRLSLMIRVRNEVQPAKIFNSERYNDILPNNCLKKPQISIRFGLLRFRNQTNCLICLHVFDCFFQIHWTSLSYAINSCPWKKLFSIFDKKFWNYTSFYNIRNKFMFKFLYEFLSNATNFDQPIQLQIWWNIKTICVVFCDLRTDKIFFKDIYPVVCPNNV